MAASSKSRGAGTILLVIVLLLGVAGASAFFIHKVLTGEDPLASLTGQTDPTAPTSAAPGENGGAVAPVQDGQDGQNGQTATAPAAGQTGAPVVLTPGETTAGASPVPQSQGTAASEQGATPAAPGTPVASSAPVPPGQFVVPPEGAPDVFAGVPVDDGSGTDTGLVPPTYDDDPDARQTAERSPGPPDPGPGLLIVPGAIETPPAAAREDAVVRPAFVDDIAAFLAQNYWPRNTHPSARRSGITTASLQWANLRYGADMRGLDGRRNDSRSARRAILDYVLNPTAVGRIYGLYSDGFVAAMHQQADKRLVGEGNGKRALTEAEKKEMFGIYAGYASRVAAALENFAADSAMPKRVEAYAETEKNVQDANRVYLESMLAYEEASAGNDNANITAARLRMDKEAATYQKRVREREAARNALVAAMSKGKGGRDDTLIYTAFWAYRRGDNSAASLRACAKALSDMGAKLNHAAK